ncbi:MAG TPA: hypothetical protein PLF31_03055 [Candidatus Paceibacterota bacterium]|nr:hypothetical protein [Candidatus Paceibacterota bacterium]
MSNEHFQLDGVSEMSEEARLLAEKEAAELAKLRAMSPEEHKALERDFWKQIGPAFREVQPDIQLPYDD